MGEDLGLQIEVQISEALRALCVGRVGLAARPDLRTDRVPPAKTATAQRPEPEPPAWQRIALRQDGARPLVFDGLPLYGAQREIADLPGTARVALDLYLSQAQVLHASMSVIPPEGFAGRPIHRACALADGEDFIGLLRAFAPETCFEPIFTTAPAEQERLAGAAQALRAAFVSMAAECLNPGMMPA